MFLALTVEGARVEEPSPRSGTDLGNVGEPRNLGRNKKVVIL